MAVLLPGTGSKTGLDTDRLMVSRAASFATDTTSTNIPLIAPAARTDVQVTTWATAAQVNPVPAMLTNDNPVGRVSTTVTGLRG
ncbi:MAG: hypothetical protein R2710_27175 [Acidimicrobiales bacterium]